MTDKDLTITIIASMLDHPSVYMGGPSQNSLRKAKKIVDYLIESKRWIDSQCTHESYQNFKTNGHYCPNCNQKIYESNDQTETS